VAVRTTLPSDANEKVVIVAHACRAVLVDIDAVSFGSTIKCTTDRTTRGEEVAGVTVTSQYIHSALGKGPIE
jgi:hypothetical protein